jgi:cytochrome c-type biogenesis protein CcmH/NrfG
VTEGFDRGLDLARSGAYRDAARAFQDVLRENPENGRAWSYLGMSLAHLGEGALAESALARAIRLEPEDGEAWFHLGVARSLRREWSEAASAYRRATGLAPDDLVAWHRLGVALAESGDSDGATVAFERALVLSRETGRPVPTDLPALADEDADPHATEPGAREDAREAESWLRLALNLLSLGDEEEAVAAYERAYTIDPERASRSLFRPMLRLMVAAEGRPIDDSEPAMGPIGDRPQGPRRPRPTVLDEGPSGEVPRPDIG